MWATFCGYQGIVLRRSLVAMSCVVYAALPRVFVRKAANLLNYFGTTDTLNHIDVYPILMTKGRTKVCAHHIVHACYLFLLLRWCFPTAGHSRAFDVWCGWLLFVPPCVLAGCHTLCRWLSTDLAMCESTCSCPLLPLHCSSSFRLHNGRCSRVMASSLNFVRLFAS